MGKEVVGGVCVCCFCGVPFAVQLFFDELFVGRNAKKSCGK